MLELCAQIRSLKGNQMIQVDQVTFTERGQSFTFRVADTLELHEPDRGKKENLSVSKRI